MSYYFIDTESLMTETNHQSCGLMGSSLLLMAAAMIYRLSKECHIEYKASYRS